MKVVFLHFPKTAGTAITRAIVRGNPHVRALPAKDMVEISRFSLRELNSYELFAGHFDWSYLDCLEGPRFVFTVLRRPLDRLVSQYYYLRELAESLGNTVTAERHPNVFECRRLPPLEYFRHPLVLYRDMILDNFDNMYAHFLFHRGYRGQRFARRQGTPRARVLEIALEHLARLDLVATFESLTSDLREVERRTGLRFVGEIGVENVTGSIRDRSPVELIRDLDADGGLDGLFREFSELDDVVYRVASRGGTPPGAAQSPAGPLARS